MWGLPSTMVSSRHSKPPFPKKREIKPSEDGVRLPTWRANWKRSHTQSSHPMQCTYTWIHVLRCRWTYRVTFKSVHPWRTLQQQLSYLAVVNCTYCYCLSMATLLWLPFTDLHLLPPPPPFIHIYCDYLLFVPVVTAGLSFRAMFHFLSFFIFIFTTFVIPFSLGNERLC